MPYIPVAGIRIYYEARGRGSPLVLLHGFGQDGRALAPLAAALGRHRRVILPDLPGQGRSGPQPRVYTADFYEEDAQYLAGFLDALRLPSVLIGGFSDGAEVALLLALRRPALVTAVLAWGVAGALSPDAAAEFAAVGTLLDAPRPEWVAWRAALLRMYGAAGVRALTTGWAAATAALLARGGDISLAHAGVIRCPVLLINGADDALNPPAAAARLAAALPRADLIVVPDTGHAVHVEEPAWFIQTATAWLARYGS